MKSKIAEELLLELQDDWLMLSAALSLFIEDGGAASEEAAFSSLVPVVRELLGDNLVEAGDVSSDGFVAWNLSHEAALSRIADEYELRGKKVGFGNICWFNLTESGQREVEKIKEYRQSI